MKLGEAMYKQAEGAQPTDTSESAIGAMARRKAPPAPAPRSI